MTLGHFICTVGINFSSRKFVTFFSSCRNTKVANVIPKICRNEKFVFLSFCFQSKRRKVCVSQNSVRMKVVCFCFFSVDKPKTFNFPSVFSLYFFRIYRPYLLYISFLVGQEQMYEFPKFTL